jgi:acyl-CoA synthetase (NDP forming)
MAAVSWYAAAKRRNAAQKNDKPPVISRPAAHALLQGKTGDVAEYAAKQVLAEYGIPVTREELAQTREAAVAAAQKIGFPVAMKVQSADISHKTEARAVRLGVANAADVATAFDEILRNAKTYKADARIDGVLVQEMVGGGIEAIAGVTNDALFGPAVMFGLGGIFAEVLKDVAFRLAPITPAIAREMVGEIKGYPVLAGARGKPPADVDALVDTLVKLSALAVDLKGQIAELDINPLIVLPKGQGVKAADALIRMKG